MLVHLSFLHVACVCSHMHSWVHTCVYLCVHMQACVHVHVHMLVYSVFVCTLYGTRSSGSPSQGCWPVTIRTTLQVALQTSDGHDGDSPPRYRHTEEHRDMHKCACAHTDKLVYTETKYNSHTPLPPKPPVVCIGTCLPQEYHCYPRNKRPSPQSPPPLHMRPSCASEHSCLETQHRRQRRYILLQMSWSVVWQNQPGTECRIS